MEEIPLLQKSLEEKQVQDKAFWEAQEKERIQQLIGKLDIYLLLIDIDYTTNQVGISLHFVFIQFYFIPIIYKESIKS